MSGRKSGLGTALESLGVKHAFGVPGTQNTAVFEALRRSDVRAITATSEVGAGFMANGYYRASGRTGVVLAIPGPGFTLALTPLAEARADSVAMVLITGKATIRAGRTFQLQAIDQAAIAGPLAKRIIDVERPAGVPGAVAEAFESAAAGEPGPVIVQLGREAVQAVTDSVPALDRHVPDSGPTADPEAIEFAADALAGAERPVLFLGQGALDAAGPIRRIAERLGAPVLTTPSGRGCLSELHPLAMGFDVLRGGVDAANELLELSDLVMALGVKFSHNGSAGYALRIPRDRFIHVDSAPHVLGANYAAARLIHADCRTFVSALEDALSGLEVRSGPPYDGISEWRERFRTLPGGGRPEPLLGGRAASEFFSKLARALGQDDVLVTDTGLHQILTRRYFDVPSPRGLIMPTDFQSMGYGVPAAIGAAVAVPDRRVVAVVGDGGFAMTGLELLTAVRDGIRLAVAVFNDGYLNQIRIDQIRDYGRQTGTTIHSPGFQDLASALGIGYARYGKDMSAEDLRRFLKVRRPVLIDIPVRDGHQLRARMAVSRGREAVRRTLPDRTVAWLKSVLGRGPVQ